MEKGGACKELPKDEFVVRDVAFSHYIDVNDGYEVVEQKVDKGTIPSCDGVACGL